MQKKYTFKVVEQLKKMNVHYMALAALLSYDKHLQRHNSNTGSPSYPGADVAKMGIVVADKSPSGPPSLIGSWNISAIDIHTHTIQ